jgi:hypothetical protein
MIQYFWKNGYLIAMLIASIILAFAIADGITTIIILMTAVIAVSIIGGYKGYIKLQKRQP